MAAWAAGWNAPGDRCDGLAEQESQVGEVSMGEDAKSKSRSVLWLCVGLTTGTVAAHAIVRWLAKPHRLTQLGIWQRRLAQTRGEVPAAMLAARVQARYDDLYAHRPHFAHSALRFYLLHLLPGLALYQVLRMEGDDQEAALKEAESLVVATSVELDGLWRVLQRSKDPFGMLRQIVRRALQYALPSPAWEAESVEDGADAIAFRIRRCFYMDVLAAYGAPELTQLYCKLDDISYESMPSTIAWQRHGTLGRGGDCCDLRFSRGRAAGD
jgi:hypothetical protein